MHLFIYEQIAKSNSAIQDNTGRPSGFKKSGTFSLVTILDNIPLGLFLKIVGVTKKFRELDALIAAGDHEDHIVSEMTGVFAAILDDRKGKKDSKDRPRAMLKELLNNLEFLGLLEPVRGPKLIFNDSANQPYEFRYTKTKK